MRTISILKLEPGQSIPRPFARACSVDEMTELLAGFGKTYKSGITEMGNLKNYFPRRVDSDSWVWQSAGSKFYAFTER